jgi:hypothetical protein
VLSTESSSETVHFQNPIPTYKYKQMVQSLTHSLFFPENPTNHRPRLFLCRIPTQEKKNSTAKPYQGLAKLQRHPAQTQLKAPNCVVGSRPCRSPTISCLRSWSPPHYRARHLHFPSEDESFPHLFQRWYHQPQMHYASS